MCTCAETCGTTGSRELCSLYHDLRLAALRRNTQCTSCAVFFLWHAPCKSSSSLMHSTWCMRATQCMPSTRSRSGSARRCDGDREYVPSSTSSRLQSWARRPISAAARDRGQRPRPRSLPRPRLTVNPSYRCDRDRGDFVDSVVPEFCCTWQRIKMQRMEGSVRLDILREYRGNHNLIRRDL